MPLSVLTKEGAESNAEKWYFDSIQNRLKHEHNTHIPLSRKFPLFFDWCIRIIYEYGSGYNQSLTRPLLVLLVMVFGVAGLIPASSCTFDESLRQGINATLYVLPPLLTRWRIGQQITRGYVEGFGNVV